ncbi:MAG: HTH-type transcriptional regulator SutR [Candidatus Anoxychlamydiales bacterium]|nr:HTH-type transcriptional regulator SutR [Candidatus Anoxychlamydiales bacterium]
MDKNNIHFKLKELRKERNLSVNRLADKIGEDYQKVGRIERGTRSMTVDYLVKISRALDVPVEALLNDQNQNNDKDANAQSYFLNKIVVLVEEKISNYLDIPKKGRLISQLYESVLKFSPNNQELFLTLVFDIIQILLDLEEEK